MSNQNGNSRYFIVMLAASTAVQLVMVVSGHFVEFIRMNVFAAGGMGISFAFGLAWARGAATSRGHGVKGGLLVGGVSALVGIALSVALGDVEAWILLVGTGSSAITGAIGGWIGHRLARDRRSGAAGPVLP